MPFFPKWESLVASFPISDMSETRKFFSQKKHQQKARRSIGRPQEEKCAYKGSGERQRETMAAVGAYAEAAEVTAEVKEIVLGKKAECETKAGATFEVFEPLTFVKQVVSKCERSRNAPSEAL